MTDSPPERAPFHPVAITGMHRSGTSMITRGLHDSGLHLIGGDADALLEAADDNPEGFWENKAVVACNDDLLEAAGGAWDNPPALLPQAVDDPRMAEIVEPATAALAGLAENDRWGFKDPRLCLTAAFWMDLQPDLRFVVCVRNPLEVALSLKRRNQNSYSLGLSLWERYYESILELVPPEQRLVTHYDSYFMDPEGELGRVCDFTGLDAAPPHVRRDLRHHDVGVSLDEANLSSGLRSLYNRLCDEAGLPAARPSSVDEGQVRRLILDGTVAARHAEQRQEAIGRLADRLADARDVEASLKEELRVARREAEQRQADLKRREQELQLTRDELNRLRKDTNDRIDRLVAQGDELRDSTGNILDQNRRLLDTTDTVAEMADGLRQTGKRIEERQQTTQDRIAHVDDILGAVHNKLRAVEAQVQPGFFGQLSGRIRRFLGRGKRAVEGPSKQAARAGLRRGVPAAKRSVKATAKRMPAPVQNNLRRVRRAVADGQAGNRIKERGQRAVATLPGPAQSVAKKGVSAVRRSGAVPKAKRVVRAVNRRLPARAQRVISKASSAPARAHRPAKKAAPAPRPKQTNEGRSTSVPKGPAAFKWQKGYERLVSEFVTAEDRWCVATPGCKPAVASVGGRVGVAFPAADGAAPAADSLSLIAVLEAHRLAGCERLVVPEGARPWIQQHAELRDHLARSYPAVADRAAAGAIYDLTAAAPTQGRGVLAEVTLLAAELDSAPAVLDWTTHGVGGELPGFTTFSPAVGSSDLPYFDRSVDIVAVSAERDLSEALRVASIGVVVVEHRGDALIVTDVERVAEGRTNDPSVMLLGVGDDPSGAADADVVILVEAGVELLPGAVDAITSAVLQMPDAAAVAKVIDAEGRLESAGGMVFADGSVAGIGEGTFDVRSPWHEFVRPVCWGGGLFAVSGARWQPEFADESMADRAARAWRKGTQVIYCPRAAVVRTGEAPEPDADAWGSLTGARPTRPASLGDGAWRYLLAHDDPAGLLGGGGR